jgi:2-iminoacetate synthase ThiH
LFRKVPGPLRRLHIRLHLAPAAQPVPGAQRGAGDRPRGRGAWLQGGHVHPGRQADRSRQAREWLDAHGYGDTLSYVRATVIRVLEETGLLTHLNPGVMSWQDFQRLKPVAPSMGIMLETAATRLFAAKARTSLIRRTNPWLWTFH